MGIFHIHAVLGTRVVKNMVGTAAQETFSDEVYIHLSNRFIVVDSERVTLA